MNHPCARFRRLRLALLVMVLTLATAVRADNLTVTTEVDEFDTPSGPALSLREALRDAPTGTHIGFDSGLAGRIFILTNSSGEIVIEKDVTIDAGSLPGGVTISGNGATRIFSVSNGHNVSLLGISFTNGYPGRFGGSGGAIFNQGILTLTRCTLSGNWVFLSSGGAILNQGTMMLTQCSLSNNRAIGGGSGVGGGAIFNQGTLALTNCTLSGNSANYPGTGRGGGAILNEGTLALTRCTLSGNATDTAGGAIRNADNALALTVTHCTISGNSAGMAAGAILNDSGPLVLNHTIAALNPPYFTPDNILGPFVGTNNFIRGVPLLAPLGNYGGLTRTMALLPGSPARNSAVGSLDSADQRGFPIVDVPDIGAYEAGTLLDYDAWAWETFPTNATAAQRAADHDYDGDLRLNVTEYATLTDPAVSNASPVVEFTPNAGGTVATNTFAIRSGATDLLYQLARGTTLINLTNILEVNLGAPSTNTYGPGLTLASSGSTLTVTDTNLAGSPELFYLLRILLTP